MDPVEPDVGEQARRILAGQFQIGERVTAAGVVAAVAAAEARGRELGRREAIDKLRERANSRWLAVGDEPMLNAAADFLESTGGPEQPQSEDRALHWCCTRCGHDHDSNPRHCYNCGYTVLAPKWVESTGGKPAANALNRGNPGLYELSTVSDPCPVCGQDNWPVGSAGNARRIHELAEHEGDPRIKPRWWQTGGPE